MHCHKKVQVQSLVSSNPEEGPYLKKRRNLFNVHMHQNIAID